MPTLSLHRIVTDTLRLQLGNRTSRLINHQKPSEIAAFLGNNNYLCAIINNINLY